MTQPEMMPTRAFVAGATGYVGRALVARLRQAGAQTTAHVRPDSPALDTWRERFAALGAEVDSTPWTAEAMTRTIARLEPTHVFAALGTTRARARHSGDAAERARPYEAVDYGLTALLLGACVTSGLRPRFVYLSAIGADARSRNEYLRVRGRLEHELRDSGLPYVVVRPSFITGRDREERRVAERLGAALTDVAVRMLGWVRLGRFGARLRSIDAATLADAMVRLALEPDGRDHVVERDELPERGAARRLAPRASGGGRGPDVPRSTAPRRLA